MSIIKVNAIQHTSANDTNMTLFANGNVTMTTANSVLRVGNTAISNSGISVAGVGISQYSGMMKNRIINGDMRIDQRFAGAANTGASTNQHVIDRWLCKTMIAGRTRFQQNNTNGPGQSATQIATGFSNYFGANVVSSNTSYSAGDQYWILQCIEGLNIQDLNWGSSVASPATLSFWVYSSIAGTHAGCFANANADRSYPFTYTINTANTWQYQTITVPGDTTGSWFSNNGIGMYVIYNLGSGTTYQSSSGNSWQSSFYQSVTNAVNVQSSANGSFYLTGVQLEKGLQATSFDFRHYGTELSLCQRYYQKTFDQATVPGSWSRNTGQGIGQCHNSGFFRLQHRFAVPMRSAPSVITYDSAGSSARVDYYASGSWNNGGTLSYGINSNQGGFWTGHDIASSTETQFAYAASAEYSIQN